MEEILKIRGNERKGNRMGRRSMRPDSESLCAQWRWFLIRLLILIGILYLLFGCIFGITTVKSEDMAPRISAGDLVLYYRLDKQPLAGDIIICNKNGKQYVDRVIAKGGDSVEITEEGTVKVNGVPVTEMGYMVKPGDVVNFDGATLTPEKKVYILLNKPKNFTTAMDEGQEYRNVLELVKGSTTAKIGAVGRMDKNTTGLLLFTNDTDMIRKFTLPSQKSSKIYQVSLDKNLKFEDLEKINKGLTLDGHRVFVEDVSYIEGEAKSEIGLQLRSSNVKVVRSIFEHFSYDVLRIDRVSFAGLTKKNLPRGNWRLLTEQEIINLKNV